MCTPLSPLPPPPPPRNSNRILQIGYLLLRYRMPYIFRQNPVIIAGTMMVNAN